MEQVARMGLFFDFYGGMLTPKQQRVFSLYYMENLSLGEIAEQEGTTRQAVHDLLQRTERILERWEEQLLLVERYLTERNTLREIKLALENLGKFIPAGSDAYPSFVELEKKIKELELYMEG